MELDKALVLYISVNHHGVRSVSHKEIILLNVTQSKELNEN